MQKYRADISETQSDGAIVWSAQWMGGPSLAKVNNCRLETLAGDVPESKDADAYYSRGIAVYK